MKLKTNPNATTTQKVLIAFEGDEAGNTLALEGDEAGNTLVVSGDDAQTKPIEDSDNGE